MGLVTKRRAAMGSAAAMILACLFGAVLILSILTGISVYRRVADRVDRSASQRVGISYLTARVHAFDEVNRVIVEAQDLKVEFLTDRLLHISYTDGAGYTETSQIYIRSGGGA